MVALEAPKNIQELANQAVVETASACGGEHELKGGYFRLHRLPSLHSKYYDATPLFEGWVGGSSNAVKIEKYKIISMEKMIRMVERAGPLGHRSSWASRNPDGGYYGGAIFLEFLVTHGDASAKYWCSLSFSGLPEEADEAAMLLLADRMPAWLHDFTSPKEICKLSGNMLAAKLLGLKI